MIQLLVLFAFLFAYPTEGADIPIEVLFHCGAKTQKDEEGRGGAGTMVSFAKRSLNHLILSQGQRFFFSPDAKEKEELEYDGIPQKSGFQYKTRGLHFAGFHKKMPEKVTMEEWDTLFFFQMEEVPLNPPTPVFSFDKNITTVIRQGNLARIPCPSQYDRLGKLDLYFRGRDLIRFHREEVKLNSKDHNRSWIVPDSDTPEKDLPMPHDLMDKSPTMGKTGKGVFVPYSFVDREILGTEIDFSTKKKAQKP